MKVLILIVALIFCSCGNEQRNQAVKVTEKTISSFKTVDYDGFEAYLETTEDQITVINFWATWCKPCIKELPYFEQIRAEYADQNLEVILVSLDFPDQKERLENFITTRKIQSEVLLLDDPDANSWIDKVDESWSGAIPATIIYNKQKRNFYERSFTFQELENEIVKFLKNENI